MSKKAVIKTSTVLLLVVVILAAGLLGTIYYYTSKPAAPPSGPATIGGKVTDAETGTPVEGATVSLDGLEYRTGSDGEYSFNVKVGTYSITVSLEGYESKTESVAATEEKTYTLDVPLKLIPPAAPAFVTENKMVYESGATYQWLDPHVSYYQYDYWTLWHSVEALVWYNRESATDVIPWLAESVNVIDPKTYEFKLRRGITFQDGTPFNATAVWFSMNRLLVMDATDGTGGHGGQAGWTVHQLLDPDGKYFTYMGAEPTYDENWVQSILDLNFVEVVDDYTVRLHLVTPTTQFLVILAGPWCGIVSPTEAVRKDYEYKGWDFAAEQEPKYDYKKYFLHMAGNGDTYFNLPEKGWTFGSGPYYVESVDPTTYKIVLKAYDEYWGGPNKMNLPPEGKKRIQTIEFVYQPSFTTRLLDLKQGTASGIGVAEADIYQVVDRDTWINQGILSSIVSDVTVHGVIPTLNCWWFDFNTNVTNADKTFKSWQPFADWRMRMAAACSVNMTHVNIYVNNRLSRLADNIIPPGTYPEGSYNPDVKPIFSLDLAKVEELLTDLYGNPITSATHDMYFYNGTKIPPGVVDNTFGPDKPQVVEFYVQSGWTTAIQILSTMVENLNSVARRVTGSRVALQFRVVIVPGGQQYTLAARHLIDGYMGGWIADYNHVLNWHGPMYYSRGAYPSWNRWNLTALDDLYWEAMEADQAGDTEKLLEINDKMNTLANEALMYMVWWYDQEYYTRSSWLKGWYLNPVYGVDIWSTMYYEQPS